MGLSLQPTRRISRKIATLIAVFALVVQPMYGLVANHVANATSATVSNQTELEEAIAPSSGKNFIKLGSSFSVDKKIIIERALTLDGGNHILSSTRNNNPNDNDNNAVLGIDNTSGVVVQNLTINRGAGKNIHGINVYHSTADINYTTITGFNNGWTKYGLVVGENSNVTVENISTSGNSRGINVDKGTAKVTIAGRSTHTESYAIYSDTRNDARVSDVNEQYARSNVLFGGHKYSLKSAPAAPTITAPASPVTTSSTDITWNAPSTSGNRNAAASYIVTIGGTSTTVSDVSHSLTGLTNGN